MPFSARQGLFAQAEAGIDADVATWAASVATADGQALEAGVITAVDTYVKGIKADGNWNNIDQLLLLSCARTLSGAAVALKGNNPTFNNFVSGDYNRTHGLTGNHNNSAIITTNYTMNYWNQSNIFVGAYQTQDRLNRTSPNPNTGNQAFFGGLEGNQAVSYSFHLWNNYVNASTRYLPGRFFNTNVTGSAGGGNSNYLSPVNNGLYSLSSDTTGVHYFNAPSGTRTESQTANNPSNNSLQYYSEESGIYYTGRLFMGVAASFINHSQMDSRTDTLYSDIQALGI